MQDSIWNSDIQAALDAARAHTRSTEGVRALGAIPAPFPSPADWRDQWIYFIMVDRFNNPAAPPRFSWDGAHGAFQGGTLNGIREQLDYLKQLGVGALWLSPVMKNCQFEESYHGYGIQDFVAIDPRLASDPEEARRNPALVEAELRALVDAAHDRGIYVILDIVLNHVGDVFEYEFDDGRTSGQADWRDEPPYAIRWRDGDGRGRADWSELPPDPPRDAAIWPKELQHDEFLRRRGNAFTRPSWKEEEGGDFYTLKELVTDFSEITAERGRYFPVRDTLIRAHQYLIAKYDVDGLRIDTLKYIEPEFARVFGNAIREYAQSIGKKNFFTFGEVYDNEEKIARFIGRNALEPGDLTGVDAALDFPLFYELPGVAKGMLPPTTVSDVFVKRQRVQRGMVSSHGDASRFFVTFLDNHDLNNRFYYSDPADPGRYDDQATLGLGCLFTLQGIPCVYYGTEQGLHGAGDSREAVREALWGKPNAFDREHPFFQAVRDLAAVRADQPALRYGRQYFRPVSGDGVHFGLSPFKNGVLAFSRILNDQELLVVANTDAGQTWRGDVIVDFALNPAKTPYKLLYSNKPNRSTTARLKAAERAGADLEVHEADGSVTRGPVRVLPVVLEPSEVQILRRGA
jgi:glycosidase